MPNDNGPKRSTSKPLVTALAFLLQRMKHRTGKIALPDFHALPISCQRHLDRRGRRRWRKLEDGGQQPRGQAVTPAYRGNAAPTGLALKPVKPLHRRLQDGRRPGPSTRSYGVPDAGKSRKLQLMLPRRQKRVKLFKRDRAVCTSRTRFKRSARKAPSYNTYRRQHRNVRPLISLGDKIKPAGHRLASLDTGHFNSHAAAMFTPVENALPPADQRREQSPTVAADVSTLPTRSAAMNCNIICGRVATNALIVSQVRVSPLQNGPVRHINRHTCQRPDGHRTGRPDDTGSGRHQPSACIRFKPFPRIR
jgi:hypothetical protein